MSLIAARLRAWARSQSSQRGATTGISGRNIYVLPTRFGVLFAILLLLMLIGSLNYDNNPAYLLTFLLISIALNAMYQTWRNLRGVTLRLLPSEPVFCGQTLNLRFQLAASDGLEHPAIQLLMDEAIAIEDLGAEGHTHKVKLTLPTGRRGWLYPGQVTVSTRYPLGLFNAWCYITLDERALIYPAPSQTSASAASSDDPADDAGAGEQPGSEDFFGLRDYRPGDAPQHIDWKSLARERGLVSKQFTAPLGTPNTFDWYALSGSVEQRISLLSRALLDAEASGISYGLRLPNIQIPPGQGAQQRHACLKALALYEPEGHSA